MSTQNTDSQVGNQNVSAMDRLYQLMAMAGSLFTVATGMGRWSKGELVIWDILLPTRQQRQSNTVVDPVHRISDRPLDDSHLVVFVFGPLGTMIYAKDCADESQSIWYSQIDRILTPVWARDSLKFLGLNLEADDSANRRAGEFNTIFPAVNDPKVAERMVSLGINDVKAISALQAVFEGHLNKIEDKHMAASVAQLLSMMEDMKAVFKDLLNHVVSDGGVAYDSTADNAESPTGKGLWYVAAERTDSDLALTGREVIGMEAFDHLPLLPERLSHGQKREITRLFREAQAKRREVSVEERTANRVMGSLGRKTGQPATFSAAPAWDKAEADAAEEEMIDVAAPAAAVEVEVEA